MSRFMVRQLQIPRMTRQQLACILNKHSACSVPVTCHKIRHCSGFKSDLSIENLYPNRDANVTKVEDFVDVKSKQFSGFIPMDQVQISTSGTEVDIRFHVESATWLSTETKENLKNNLGSELTKDGWLVVKSDRTVTKTLNMADALEKLRTNVRNSENPKDETFPLLQVEQQRKERLKLARERLHIKV